MGFLLKYDGVTYTPAALNGWRDPYIREGKAIFPIYIQTKGAIEIEINLGASYYPAIELDSNREELSLYALKLLASVQKYLVKINTEVIPSGTIFDLNNAQGQALDAYDKKVNEIHKLEKLERVKNGQ